RHDLRRPVQRPGIAGSINASIALTSAGYLAADWNDGIWRGFLMDKQTLNTQSITNLQAVISASRTETATTTSDWKQALPVLTGSMVTLRELRTSDATSLLAMLSTEEVARFISPPPTTVEGFERFIAWTHRERAAGNY